MQAAADREELSKDEAQVRDWRRLQFRRLGFDSFEADLLAGSDHVDLGVVRRMAALGCDPDLILRIVL